jgi:hypothetical protein
MLKSLGCVLPTSAESTIVALVFLVLAGEAVFATTNFVQLDAEVSSTLQTVLCGTERPSKGSRLDIQQCANTRHRTQLLTTPLALQLVVHVEPFC